MRLPCGGPCLERRTSVLAQSTLVRHLFGPVHGFVHLARPSRVWWLALPRVGARWRLDRVRELALLNNPLERWQRGRRCGMTSTEWAAWQLRLVESRQTATQATPWCTSLAAQRGVDHGTPVGVERWQQFRWFLGVESLLHLTPWRHCGVADRASDAGSSHRVGQGAAYWSQAADGSTGC